ncbi:glycoside hydrolase family 36 protein [Aeromicrobium sp. P5_D10]
MTQRIEWGTQQVSVVLDIGDRVAVRYIGPRDPEARLTPMAAALGPTEVLFSGDALPQGSRHVLLGTSLGLRYAGHRSWTEGEDLHLEIEQRTPADGAGSIRVTTLWSVSEAVPVLRARTELTNESDSAVTLEHISSFVYCGVTSFEEPGWQDAVHLQIAHNTLYGEFQWRSYTLPELGLSDVGFTSRSVQSSKKRIALTSTGTQPTTEFLPSGVLSDTARGQVWAWQIEHNGPWHWEIGDNLASVYLSLSGPSDVEHHWHQALEPGERFTTVPVAIAISHDAETAFAALTSHRRKLRRASRDNVELPVVFNDFMNCLNADPSEEKLVPLIDAAANAGCEVFCVDAGWYSDDRGWWTTVGEWEESRVRFPNGLRYVLDLIRERGMTPGLWIEPEVVGIDSPLVDELPDAAFFWRHGRRVVSQGRHQLDFRCAAVTDRMDRVIDRIVTDYDLGYVKFDYNINGGVGSDFGDASSGAALLEHNRAYLDWVDGLFQRYPDLVIEACSSGGARVDYATLARHSLLSTSDQTDPALYVPIAASSPAAVTPEQAAIWVYPQPEFDDELNALCVVNAMLGRPQVSGGLAQLSGPQMSLVREGISVYKTYRAELSAGQAFWPDGLPLWDAEWTSLGMTMSSCSQIALWRRGGPDHHEVLLEHLRGQDVSVEMTYPTTLGGSVTWDSESGILRAHLPMTPSARLITLHHN